MRRRSPPRCKENKLMKKIVATGDWNNEIEATFKASLDEYKKTGSW